MELLEIRSKYWYVPNQYCKSLQAVYKHPVQSGRFVCNRIIRVPCMLLSSPQQFYTQKY
jgi:hypothetical protein